MKGNPISSATTIAVYGFLQRPRQKETSFTHLNLNGSGLPSKCSVRKVTSLYAASWKRAKATFHSAGTLADGSGWSARVSLSRRGNVFATLKLATVDDRNLLAMARHNETRELPLMTADIRREQFLKARLDRGHSEGGI